MSDLDDLNRIAYLQQQNSALQQRIDDAAVTMESMLTPEPKGHTLASAIHRLNYINRQVKQAIKELKS